MQTELNLFHGIEKLFSHHNILSISGESGTGKTTLVLQLIGNLMTEKEPYKDSCIWVQASERFPVKRISQIFEDNPQKLEYVVNNIYTIPQKGPIYTYEEQSSIIEKILNPNFIVPPYLKYLVIDNISHHLRYKITHFNTPQHVSYILDSFYDTILMPFIIFCKRNGIILFIIHEVTYNPTLQKLRPFFYKLYDRIQTIDIELRKVINTENKDLLIEFNDMKWNFQFILKHKGIELI